MNLVEIKDLKAPELEIYTSLNEKQVKKYFEPNPGLFICESEKVIRRALEAGYEPVSFFVEDSKISVVEALDFDESVLVFHAPYLVMKEITGYSLSGGILAAMKRKGLQSLEDFLESHQKLVVLDDVENPTNVGAIIRSAAALGADGVLLTKACSDPLYRRAARVSMGTVFLVDWMYMDGDVASLLKQHGFYVLAMALCEGALPISELSFTKEQKRAIVLGNEDHGVSDEVLEHADACVIIPMKAGVDSLNVAAASAVAFWEVF
ncbi:MAG: RNA methyltransferase [Lachnospiraceae bacterium]|nr:RNA methyltransferase [Lachnospiraceae bacterium]